MHRSKYAVAIATAIALVACGDIGSKPSEPVEDGGPTTSPNIGFPGTNSGTNNAANNEATNNVVVTNNSANNTGNVATNSVSNCPELVPPAGPTGFDEEPADFSGFIGSLNSNEMVIELDNGDRATFSSVGLDLTNYFVPEESVTVVYSETENETRSSVGGETAVVEHLRASATATGEKPELIVRSQFGVFMEQLDGDSEFCTVEGECGLQERTLGTPEIIALADDIETFISPGMTQTVESEGIPVQVHLVDSRLDIIQPTTAGDCEAPGSSEAEISIMLASTRE